MSSKAPATTTQVAFSYNPVQPPACYPADVNGLAQLFTQGGVLAGTIPANSGGGIFVGSAPPSSSLTFQVWFKTDSAGRPLGAYMFYNGNWRKVYTGVGFGEIRMYFGSGNNFDGTGLGVVGGDTDGWAICNGQNGTPNLTDMRFPAGGAWDGNNWSSGGSARGGQNNHALVVQDLPLLKVTLGSAAGRWAAGSAGGWVTVPPAGNPTTNYDTVVADANGIITSGFSGKPLPPPAYQVFGFIMFVGYS